MVLKIILVLALIVAVYFDVKYYRFINLSIKCNIDSEYRINKIKHYMLEDREMLFKVYKKFEEYVHEKHTSESNVINDNLYKLNDDFITMTKIFDDDFKMTIENIDQINNSIKYLNQYIDHEN